MLYQKPDLKGKNGELQIRWSDACRKQIPATDSDASQKIQVIQDKEAGWLIGDCAEVPLAPWKTGRGLCVWDFSRRVIQLYGELDSRSPSTKGGQQLELL